MSNTFVFSILSVSAQLSIGVCSIQQNYEESYICVLKITVSRAKMIDAARPRSRLNSNVDTQVTNHTTWWESA